LIPADQVIETIRNTMKIEVRILPPAAELAIAYASPFG
jgi:hypothetical protein